MTDSWLCCYWTSRGVVKETTQAQSQPPFSVFPWFFQGYSVVSLLLLLQFSTVKSTVDGDADVLIQARGLWCFCNL